MVNETILGALKSALARGESLKKAMMTLYNAGYKKEEISEAAYLVNKPSSVISTPPSSKSKLRQSLISLPNKKLVSKKSPKKAIKSAQKSPIVQQPTQQLPQQPIKNKTTSQRVSNYGQSPKTEGKTMIIILGFLLLLLIGILAAIFLFKDDLLNFFNNLFS